MERRLAGPGDGDCCGSPSRVTGQSGRVCPAMANPPGRGRWGQNPPGRAVWIRIRRPGPTGSEVESAGAAVAVGEQSGQGGDGDLGRDPGADVEPDRPVHAGDL